MGAEMAVDLIRVGGDATWSTVMHSSATSPVGVGRTPFNSLFVVRQRAISGGLP